LSLSPSRRRRPVRQLQLPLYASQSSYGMDVVAFRMKPRVPFSHQLLEFDLGRDELFAIDVPSHGCFLSRFAQSGAVHLHPGPGQ